MKIDQLFDSIPFPYRIQTTSPYSVKLASPGHLFDTPSYDGANDNFWESIDSIGWFTCRAGFAVLAKKLPGFPDHLLILHGLKVKPFWVQRGGTKGLSIVLDVDRIDSYVNNLLIEFSRLTEMVDQEIDIKTRVLATENVHEIRSMTTSLYHAGYELQEQLIYDDKHKLALAKNIVALSELISARIELIDLAASGFSNSIGHITTPIPVYRKFDKLIKCYIAYASKREIILNIFGESRSQTRGMEHFEMIPLIVIDNAVKYSPNKKSIDISFREDSYRIYVEVKSLGPKIETSELNCIFDKEVRGKNAISSGQGGSGIGLYFARCLMSSIGANIVVAQENTSTTFLMRQYYLTTFTLDFEKIQ